MIRWNCSFQLWNRIVSNTRNNDVLSELDSMTI